MPSASGLSPREVLSRSLAASRDLMQQHASTFHESIAPALRAEGIAMLHWDDLRDDEKAAHQHRPTATACSRS